MQHFRRVLVQREDLPHEVAHRLVSALEKHQDRGPGAAQCAAEQPGRAQFENVFEAGHECGAIWLVKLVFERGGEGAGGAGGKRGDQQGRPLHVENGFRARITIREHRTRLLYALGDRLVPASSADRLFVLTDDRLGLFADTDGLFSGFAGAERSEDLGSRVQAAAGPQASQPVVVAYTLGRGLVIRSGLSQWSARLGRDANVDAVTRRAWTLLSR